MKTVSARVAFFIAVGCAAAATHFAVVVFLVSQWAVPPLAANVLGWLIAFVVSFTGHWRLTFRAQQAPLLQSVRRFFGISLAAFTLNETAYAVMLHWTAMRYDIVLALILVAVAVITYLLSSRWAFLGTPR
jgi:putative flippase GtrA